MSDLSTLANTHEYQRAKCGFTIVSEGKGYANARGAEIEEFVLMLPVR